jgi:hypothetical protein
LYPDPPKVLDKNSMRQPSRQAKPELSMTSIPHLAIRIAKAANVANLTNRLKHASGCPTVIGVR